MRRLLVVLAVALVVPVSAFGSSLARPPAVVSSIAIVEPGPYAFDDVLTFATSVEKLAGWEYPMVAVSCYQDVNGDSVIDTDLLGPDIVFAWLDRPDASFWLGEYASPWRQRGGGPAECRADLDAYGWKGGQEFTRVLASAGFVASG